MAFESRVLSKNAQMDNTNSDCLIPNHTLSAYRRWWNVLLIHWNLALVKKLVNMYIFPENVNWNEL